MRNKTMSQNYVAEIRRTFRQGNEKRTLRNILLTATSTMPVLVAAGDLVAALLVARTRSIRPPAARLALQAPRTHEPGQRRTGRQRTEIGILLHSHRMVLMVELLRPGRIRPILRYQHRRQRRRDRPLPTQILPPAPLQHQHRILSLPIPVVPALDRRNAEADRRPTHRMTPLPLRQGRKQSPQFAPRRRRHQQLSHDRESQARPALRNRVSPVRHFLSPWTCLSIPRVSDSPRRSRKTHLLRENPASGFPLTFREKRERFAKKQPRTDPATNRAATETRHQIARKPRCCAGHKAASMRPPEPALRNQFLPSATQRPLAQMRTSTGRKRRRRTPVFQQGRQQQENQPDIHPTREKTHRSRRGSPPTISATEVVTKRQIRPLLPKQTRNTPRLAAISRRMQNAAAVTATLLPHPVRSKRLTR